MKPELTAVRGDRDRRRAVISRMAGADEASVSDVQERRRRMATAMIRRLALSLSEACLRQSYGPATLCRKGPGPSA